MLAFKTNNTINACIAIKKLNDIAYIGSFAVHPQLQNAGLGKTVLALGEQYAVKLYKPKYFAMSVVSSRYELIEYYERRGYQRTGKISPYPTGLNVGVPRKELFMEELIKPV